MKKYKGKQPHPQMQTPQIGDTEVCIDRMGNWRRKIWVKCPSCGRERWVTQKNKNMSPYENCCSPQNEKSPCWKGGRQIVRKGYVWVKLPENSPFISMGYRRNNRTRWVYIPEHRLIMAEHLGRTLEKNEIIHHVNGNKGDNRLDNLQLSTLHTHKLSYKAAYNDGYKAGLKERDKGIERQIKLLQWLIKDLSESLKLKMEI